MSVDSRLAGLKRTVAELLSGEQTTETVGAAQRWIEARAHLSSAAIFAELQRMISPRGLVEKSPTNTRPDALARIRDSFPDAVFLHVTRHPRANCRSQHSVYKDRGPEGDQAFDYEQHWRRRNRLCLEFGATLPASQYMLLHGEWVFEDPRTVFAQISEWLGLRTDDTAIDAMMRPEDSPYAKIGPAGAFGGNNKGFMANPQLRAGRIPKVPLAGPLDWMAEPAAGFDPKTRHLAHQLGYGWDDLPVPQDDNIQEVV